MREFLAADAEAVVGRLSSRHVAFHASAEAEQVRAWKREIEILRQALSGVECAIEWSILLEAPLLRLGKRMDAVLLAPGIVVVVEFKIGATTYTAADQLQTERYAHSLRDFHEASQKRLVIPILCAERASKTPLAIEAFDGVAETLLANADTLTEALRLVAERVDGQVTSLTGDGFDYSAYRPTPTIVEAAQALYAGHGIAEIGRGDAADAELQRAAQTLQEIAAEAEQSKQRVICFVTGAPGAGKTLLGLDLALRSRGGDRPAALLTGNRPLVHVLTEALAVDQAKRTGVTKAKAKYQADAAIQNLLRYLKEHTDGPPPPEHVIVFDEAQRAWDEEVGQELMGRPKSEPELFLDILERLDWACLVCLVGPGQEINRGEGGLPLWGAALRAATERGQPWKLIAAPQALDGGPDVAGAGLLETQNTYLGQIKREPALHLSNAIRAYRNPLHGRWVAKLLEGEIAGAQAIAAAMDEPPVRLTRDLEEARTWLRERRRGGRSVGLLCSSGAVRLIGEGVPPAPRSNELDLIGHWFLKPHTDFRSAGALEVPLSEFGCQGLELDYVGLCWGGDLIWSDEEWTPRRMSSPRWQVVRQAVKARFRVNAYRVLLTRARAGSIIYVPKGSDEDPTRPPSEADAVASVLIAAGATYLGG